MILIACNTGVRPAEMKNLRWRDIMPAKDREGREIVVLFVQGKGKSRKLVAPKSVGDYLERIRVISLAAYSMELAVFLQRELITFRHEEIVQPYCLVNIETLQRGLIEDEDGTE
jgi:integrase